MIFFFIKSDEIITIRNNDNKVLNSLETISMIIFTIKKKKIIEMISFQVFSVLQSHKASNILFEIKSKVKVRA
jgi:hypothetical protein